MVCFFVFVFTAVLELLVTLISLLVKLKPHSLGQDWLTSCYNVLPERLQTWGQTLTDPWNAEAAWSAYFCMNAKVVAGTLRASLSGTYLGSWGGGGGGGGGGRTDTCKPLSEHRFPARKDVVNQCLETGAAGYAWSLM